MFGSFAIGNIDFGQIPSFGGSIHYKLYFNDSVLVGDTIQKLISVSFNDSIQINDSNQPNIHTSIITQDSVVLTDSFNITRTTIRNFNIQPIKPTIDILLLGPFTTAGNMVKPTITVDFNGI